MMLIDSNIFMYAAGVDHPNKKSSLQVLQQVVRGAVAGCTSVEILQEILHRYRSIDRWQDGKKVFETAKIIAKIVTGSVTWIICVVAVFGKWLGKWSDSRVSRIAAVGFIAVAMLFVASLALPNGH